MTEETYDKELDALKTDIARLREEIASLAVGVKKFAGAKAAGAQGEEELEAAEEEGGEQSFGVFADLWHKFDSSRIHGEKVVKGLADEVERYPLVSVMAAFGLGYIIAKLWYQENKQ